MQAIHTVHTVQMILLIAAIAVFAVVLSGPLVWARQPMHHYQRPISHSNHAALLRYYNTPPALRAPVQPQKQRFHFEQRRHRHHPGDLHHTPHSHHGHHNPYGHDIYIEWAE